MRGGGSRARRARGRGARDRDVPLGVGPLPPHRSDAARRRARDPGRVRRHPVWRRRLARGARSRDPVGPAAGHRPGIRSRRQPPTGPSAARDPRAAGGPRPDDVDLVVVRENTEGEYSGIGGFTRRGLPGEVAVQTTVYSRDALARTARFAFELARARVAGSFTSVTKSNASRTPASCGTRSSPRSPRATPTSTGSRSSLTRRRRGSSWRRRSST